MPPVKRSPRNSVNDRPSGWRLALRRQRRLMKPLAALAVLGVIAIALLGVVSSVATRSGRTLLTFRDKIGLVAAASGLRVTDIKYEGVHNTPMPILQAALGIHEGDPILGFSLDDARANLERIPWVETAAVERRLPGTIVINIEERRPIAIWQNKDRLYLVDAKGQVVTNEDISQFRFLPRIVGAGAPAAAEPLLNLLRDRPALAAKVFACVRIGERRWNLRLTSGADVLLPEGHEAAAMDRLMQLEQDHSLLERPLAAIDMRLPDRLVFRPRDAAKTDGKADAKIDSKETTAPLPTPPTVPVTTKKPT